MKTEPLPKWIMKKYAALWHKFKEKEFTYEDVTDLFKGENVNVIRTMISQLRKSGWLSFEISAEDSRKRIYRLRGLDEVLEGMVG